MAEQRRRMAFFEIARGRFASDMQEQFETAQRISTEKKGQVKITTTITINPPDPNDPEYSTIKYGIKLSTPPIQSKEFSTEMRDGYIIDDGDDIGALLQEKLKFPDIPNDVQARIDKISGK